jgi:hypothetical protein
MINSNTFPKNLKSNFSYWFTNNRISITTLILLIGLIAFEMFNYSTTDYALKDLLGNLKFAGLFWSTILAVAFCLIDFAGISKLFMPGNSISNLKEDWFLFGAWFLAATMNAILTWWGVSMSIINHSVMSSKIIDPETIHLVVPIFVSIMVWVTRILLIGSLTLSGQKPNGSSQSRNIKRPNHNTILPRPNPLGSTLSAQNASMQSKSSAPSVQRNSRFVTRPEPEYISDQANSIHQPAFKNSNQNNQTIRRF